MVINQLIPRLRARATARTLAGTTFCDGCGGVCTPEGRREALRERRQEQVRRAALYRF